MCWYFLILIAYRRIYIYIKSLKLSEKEKEKQVYYGGAVDSNRFDGQLYSKCLLLHFSIVQFHRRVYYSKTQYVKIVETNETMRKHDRRKSNRIEASTVCCARNVRRKKNRTRMKSKITRATVVGIK